MDLELTGDVAVVVGGANGIGKAIAEAFASENARVVVLDYNRSAAKAAAAQIGPLASACCADVTDDDQLRRAAEEVIAREGRCEHLVYAAGAGSGKYGFPFWKLNPADWPHVLDVNLNGAVRAAQAFLPHMLPARKGTLLFISSVAGQIGSQTDPPYSAAKAALINFAQCAAKDLAEHNIRVNTICPGMVKTALNQSVWQAWNARQPPDLQQDYESWAGEKVRRIAPLARWQTPADIAALAVFLASHKAQNITGQTMNVDGGQVMRG